MSNTNLGADSILDDAEPRAEIGRQLNLTEGSIEVALHRLRQRFREILRAEVLRL